jgi:uncharacterized protein YkwD
MSVAAPVALYAQDAAPAPDVLVDLPAQTPPAPDVAFTTPDLSAPLAGEMLSREATLIYIINTHRRQAGVPPLRWNRELSEASQWFARDSVVTEPRCGHTDSLGRGPGTRMRVFGYINPSAWGQTISCGFTEPAAIAQAWMTNPETRAVLLDPKLREAGPGYFYSAEKQRGYIALLVGADDSYAPMVINDERAVTDSPQVTLTIHRQSMTPVAMKVSNSPDFTGAAWEPFAMQKAWTLPPGTGWKSVYVLTRDALGCTTLLSDSIYLGSSVPADEITLAQASNIGSALSISGFPQNPGPAVRMSMGWVLDNTSPAVAVLGGASELVANPNAVGGSEVRLFGGWRETQVRGTMYGLPPNRIHTAYFRLKVADNSSAQEVARIAIRNGTRTFGPVVIQANHFAAANVYQEFAITFAFDTANALPDAEVELRRTGEVDLTFDTVRFYGQPVRFSPTVLWSAGDAHYRSNGVQARFDNGTTVSEPFDVGFSTVDNPGSLVDPSELTRAWPENLVITVHNGVVSPQSAVLVVCQAACPDGAYRAAASVPWIQLEQLNEGMLLSIDAASLGSGIHDAFVSVSWNLAGIAAAGVEIELPEEGKDTDFNTLFIPVRVAVSSGEPGVAPPPPPPAPIAPPAAGLNAVFVPVAFR